MKVLLQGLSPVKEGLGLGLHFTDEESGRGEVLLETRTRPRSRAVLWTESRVFKGFSRSWSDSALSFSLVLD